MDHAYYGSYAGLLAAELLGLTALCDDEATFYVRRHVEINSMRLASMNAAQAADWPRLAAPGCRPGQPLAPVKAARRQSGRTLVGLVSDIGAARLRGGAGREPQAQLVARRLRPGRPVSSQSPRDGACSWER
eukprot:scaffold31868_cov67-Phaeocystis_antarctica.AAC.2